MKRKHRPGNEFQVLIVTALMAGSFGMTAQADAATNVAPETPPIHIRQEAWVVRDGAPAVRQDYEEAAAVCRKAGAALDFTPLSSDTIAKLGHTYYDIWYQGSNMSIHSVSWGFKMGPSGTKQCHFTEVRSEREAIANAHGAYSINLDDGTVVRDPAYRVVRNAAPAESQAQKTKAQNEEAAVMAELRKQGYGGIADQAQTTTSQTTIAGQPCLMTKRKDGGSTCFWSGGAKWGFKDEGSIDDIGYISGYDPDLTHVDEVQLPGAEIPLSSKPSNGVGTQLVTNQMTVDQSPETDPFKVPDGLRSKASTR